MLSVPTHLFVCFFLENTKVYAEYPTRVAVAVGGFAYLLRIRFSRARPPYFVAVCAAIPKAAAPMGPNTNNPTTAPVAAATT
mmetsp:Transcript_20297/g.47000  ORF Transcript_20297/g.47000 Transcript_20297/m.47000 type:complete len:82 (-) Transcript_20297:468-713(-)